MLPTSMAMAASIRFPFIISGSTGVKKHLFPGINRRQFADQVPAIKKQFLHHAQYAKATKDEIFKGKGRIVWSC